MGTFLYPLPHHWAWVQPLPGACRGLSRALWQVRPLCSQGVSGSRPTASGGRVPVSLAEQHQGLWVVNESRVEPCPLLCPRVPWLWGQADPPCASGARGDRSGLGQGVRVPGWCRHCSCRSPRPRGSRGAGLQEQVGVGREPVNSWHFGSPLWSGDSWCCSVGPPQGVSSHAPNIPAPYRAAGGFWQALPLVPVWGLGSPRLPELLPRL